MSDTISQQIDDALAALAAEKLKLEGWLSQDHPPNVMALLNQMRNSINTRERELGAMKMKAEIVAIQARAYALAEEYFARPAPNLPEDWKTILSDD